MTKLIILLLLLQFNAFAMPDARRDIGSLGPETVDAWVEFVEKHAPANYAYKALHQLLNYNSTNKAHIINAYLAVRFRDSFVKGMETSLDNTFKENIDKVLLFHADTAYLKYYIKIAKTMAPSDDGLIVLRRAAESYINMYSWQEAIDILKEGIEYYPNRKEFIEEIINILQAPEQGIKPSPIAEHLNTEFDEWDPTMTANERFLYFSSSREGGLGAHDIWFSVKENGKYSKPINVGEPLNGEFDETIDNISFDGNLMLFSGNLSGSFGKYDIYMAEKEGLKWATIQHLPFPINTEHHEEGGFLSSDGKTLLFASDRPLEGKPYITRGRAVYNGSKHGNINIYVSFMSDSGWSTPINLGPDINTNFAEKSPYLHPDGKTLYFSSDGHPGLGRVDVYKSERLDSTWTKWSKPINLGKEINTINDDWGYKVNLEGTKAIFAAHNRTIGKGQWDIFQVQLPDKLQAEKTQSVTGLTKDINGKALQVYISWEDLDTGENIGNIMSDFLTGEYLIALPKGRKYGYYFHRPNYVPLSGHIDLTKTLDSNKIVKLDITLYKIDQVSDKNRVSLNNIFFDFDSFKIKKESFSELNRLAQLLKNEKSIAMIVIEGHTDDSGSDEYNLKLSNQRADEIKNYLIGKGIDRSRVKAIGMGKSKPKQEGNSEYAKQQNRRVEIYFEIK